MPNSFDTSSESLVLIDETNGVTVIPQLAELRRLNWFDGKLLRADDLRVEQDHVRALVRRANAAGGRGVVHGLTCTLGGDGRLHVGPGLAIDPRGRSLVLPVNVPLDVQQLIDRTTGAHAAAAATTGASKNSGAASYRATSLGTKPLDTGFTDCVAPAKEGQPTVGTEKWFVITVGWAEGLCGNEEVYGRLCEDACSSSTDRPWRIDGLVFRARPIQPRQSLVASSAVALDDRHERSRLASALFADEREDAGSTIFGAGLRSGVWCAGAGADVPVSEDVPIGLIARAGGVTTFLDIWTVRRERIDPPPRRYWAGRMAMRPWDVFLAQVLQFQCQLTDVLEHGSPPPVPGYVDPCIERQHVLEQAVAELGKRPPAVETTQGDEGDDAQDAVLAMLTKKMISLQLSDPGSAQRRALIDGGIIELPPAGYLPVDPGGPPTVEAQVQGLVGGGVDLTFCTTPADAVARELEQAQHLDRISLLRGIDDPSKREQVEIIVPDAEIQEVAARDAWHGVVEIARREIPTFNTKSLAGAGRVGTAGEFTLRWAGSGVAAASANELRNATLRSADINALDTKVEPDTVDEQEIAGAVDVAAAPPSAWIDATADRDPLTLAEGDSLRIDLAGDIIVPARRGKPVQRAISGSFRGKFTLVRRRPHLGGVQLYGTVSGSGERRTVLATGKRSSGSTVLNGVEALVQSESTVDGGVALTVRLPATSDVVIIATLTWHGDADSVELAVQFESQDAKRGLRVTAASDTTPDEGSVGPDTTFVRDFARLMLEREPGAATIGDPSRVSAEQALHALEKALGEPGYAAAALRLLFPTQDAGIRLRATRDWVMFRRRAVLRCGPLVAPPVETQTFAVYGLGPPPLTFVPAPTPLGEIAFARDTTDVVGGTQSLTSRWESLIGGAQDELTAVAVLRGAPGGDELSKRRATALATVLSAVTPLGAGFAAASADALPVDPGAADGVMLVRAAEKPVTTVAVAIVIIDPALVQRYLPIMTSTDTAEVAKAFKLLSGTDGVQLSDRIHFPSGEGEKASDPDHLTDIVLKYQNDPGLSIQALHVISVDHDPDAGDETLRLERASTVSAEFDANIEPQLFTRDEPEFVSARAMGIKETTIIVVVPLPEQAPQPAGGT